MKTTKENITRWRIIEQKDWPDQEVWRHGSAVMIEVSGIEMRGVLDDLDELTTRLEKAEGLLKQADDLLCGRGIPSVEWIKAYKEFKNAM